MNLGIVRADLDELGEAFGHDGLPVVVEWLGLKSAIYVLLSEIVVGTNRVVDLVRALKTYTYMDQAPVQDVDVRSGLENTLVILHNKLKHGVAVVREFDADVPPIQAYASELNQVWTNLIDNAIDAMQGEGTLTLRVRRAGEWVEVQIEDDGPGYPRHPLEALRPLLHDEAAGGGDRPGPRDLAEHRREEAPRGVRPRVAARVHAIHGAAADRSGTGRRGRRARWGSAARGGVTPW